MSQTAPLYTAEEKAYLLANYATASKEEIMAAVPGRDWRTLVNKAAKLGATGRPRYVYIKPEEERVWTPELIEQMEARYAQAGPQGMAALLTQFTLVAIRAQASRMKLRYLKPKPVKPAKVAKVKPAPVVKAVAPPKPKAAKVAPKRSAATPHLNAQKAKVERSADAKKFAVVYTASEIRAMPYGSAIRQVYTRGGDPAVRAYLAARP